MLKEIPSAQTDPIYTTSWHLLQTYFPTSQTSDVFQSSGYLKNWARMGQFNGIFVAALYLPPLVCSSLLGRK